MVYDVNLIIIIIFNIYIAFLSIKILKKIQYIVVLSFLARVEIGYLVRCPLLVD